MDITQLRAFVAVAREGNLTRAAEQLHVTQPAVSLQIKALQETLQVQLFNRVSGGMALTNDGARLLPMAEQTLASLAELRQAAAGVPADSTGTLSGTLSIGTILDPEFIRLGAFLKGLVERYPLLSTVLRHGMSGDVLQQVSDGALDGGYYIGMPPGQEFHCVSLTDFTYRVVAPRGWKQQVAGKQWNALARLPWIWTPPESAHHRMLSRIFQPFKVRPRIVALVDQEPSMLDLVKSGVGLSLVRDSIALKEAHAHGLVIADAVSLTTELSFLVQEKRRCEPAILAMFHVLQDVWAA